MLLRGLGLGELTSVTCMVPAAFAAGAAAWGNWGNCVPLLSAEACLRGEDAAGEDAAAGVPRGEKRTRSSSPAAAEDAAEGGRCRKMQKNDDGEGECEDEECARRDECPLLLARLPRGMLFRVAVALSFS